VAWVYGNVPSHALYRVRQKGPSGHRNQIHLQCGDLWMRSNTMSLTKDLQCLRQRK
jgi:hypothetical protein